MIDDILQNRDGLKCFIQYLECDKNGIPTGRLKKDTPKEIKELYEREQEKETDSDVLLLSE